MDQYSSYASQYNDNHCSINRNPINKNNLKSEINSKFSTSSMLHIYS